MNARRCVVVACIVLMAAAVAGTRVDAARPAAVRSVDAYQLLAVDFHVHSFPFSWSTLSVFDTVIDAHWHGLDAVVLTPHNHIWVARVGDWFSRAIGGPIVVVGEEITAPGYHLLAAGLHETVPPTLTAADAIAAIHAQGGVAIAAHPFRPAWPSYDTRALGTLDGSEIVRPETLHLENLAAELQAFRGRGRFAAVGATDFHGLGPVGAVRTYVFARERSAQGVIDAVRDRRTMAYDGHRWIGDPALIARAVVAGVAPPSSTVFPRRDVLSTFSRLATVLTLAWVLLFAR